VLFRELGFFEGSALILLDVSFLKNPLVTHHWRTCCGWLLSYMISEFSRFLEEKGLHILVGKKALDMSKHIYWGSFPILPHIFQMGWFNHQPGKHMVFLVFLEFFPILTRPQDPRSFWSQGRNGRFSEFVEVSQRLWLDRSIEGYISPSKTDKGNTRVCERSK